MSGASQAPRRLALSVEIFPPADAAKRGDLAGALSALEPVAPDFISVTYGAGGSTRERTFDMVERIVRDTPLDVAAHLTCVNASRDEVDATVRNYLALGVRRIVALRGDPPGGLDVPYEAHPQGYQRTADLVAGIRRIADFDISVAAYPEKHPQSPDFSTDFDTLKAKVDSGASRALTQFFFDNDLFFRFIDQLGARGIEVPVVPGILPIVNPAQVCSFAGRCGATVPPALLARYEGLGEDAEARAALGAEIAARQIDGLAAAGFPAVHIYCLNRPELVARIWSQLATGRTATATA